MNESAPSGRDLRLDLFRGLALAFIFLDHIPNNAASWITLRNYGFSDATEIFVFISGYSAALAYGGVLRRRGFLQAAARILRRCWQVYAAHVFLFVVFTAHIAWVAQRYDNPMYAEEMQIVRFLDEPHIVLGQALLLKFNPANMDVLPLYVALLLVFPLALKALTIAPNATLAVSAALHVVATTAGWNLPAYPSGHWLFNPFAWQLLFVLGAWCGLGRLSGLRRWTQRPLDVAALAMLLAALWIAATWHLPRLEPTVPLALRRAIYPIDKTNLDLLRLAHFLALAWLAARLTPRRSAFMESPPLRPLMLCGRQSLHVFCVGVFLSFVGHWLLVEIDGSLWSQLAVSLAGLVAMTAVAAVAEWFKRADAPASAGARAAAAQ